MLVSVGTTSSLASGSEEVHSLELHFATPNGVMRLNSQPDVGLEAIVVQTSKESKSDIMYVVQDSKMLLAATERVRKLLQAKQQDIFTAKIMHVRAIEGTPYLSILLSYTKEGVVEFIHYFANDYYNAAGKVQWQADAAAAQLLPKDVIVDASALENRE